MQELYETSADPPKGPVLVTASLCVHPGSFCAQTGPAEGAKSGGSLIAPNRLTRARHKQHLTKAYIRVFADLANVYKQIQRSSQNVKTKTNLK